MGKHARLALAGGVIGQTRDTIFVYNAGTCASLIKPA